MDIKGLNSYNQFYSPTSVQRNKPIEAQVQPEAKTIDSGHQPTGPIDYSKDISAVTTLNADEKTYFAKEFENNPQVQTYLGSGQIQQYFPKGQVLDLRG